MTTEAAILGAAGLAAGAYALHESGALDDVFGNGEPSTGDVSREELQAILSGTTGNAELDNHPLRRPLIDAQKEFEKKFSQMDCAARKAGLEKLKEEGVNTELTGNDVCAMSGNELVTSIGTVLGGAAGSAACSPGGAGLSSLCGALGSAFGAWLGESLPGFLDKRWDNIKDWFGDAWDGVTGWTDDAWDWFKDGIGGLF